jgi:DNA-binding NarL/FixJ family response regulator
MSHGGTISRALRESAPLNDGYGVAIQIRNRTLREAVAAQLDNEPDLRVVGAAANPAEIPRLCELRSPRVVLFEIDSGQGSPVTLIANLRARHRPLRLIGLHDRPEPDPQLAERLQLAGLDQLVSYVGGVAGIIAAARPPIGAGVPDGVVPHRTSRLITDRELRILHLISSGHTVGEVAAALQISARAVENYKRRIFAKLDTHSQAHAAARAVQLGLLPPAAEPDARPVPEPATRGTVAVLGGRPGPLADRIAELLIGSQIPLVVARPGSSAADDDQSPHHQASRVVVLADPDPADWSIAQDLPCRILLVSTAAPDQAAVVDAVLRGADALISASELTETLVPAFHFVENGYLVVNAERARKFIGARYTRTNPSGPPELTPREQQILSLIDRGYSVKQTARALGISVKTVESLQTRLFRKLGIRNRAEALVVAYGLGLMNADYGDGTDQCGLPEATAH